MQTKTTTDGLPDLTRAGEAIVAIGFAGCSYIDADTRRVIEDGMIYACTGIHPTRETYLVTDDLSPISVKVTVRTDTGLDGASTAQELAEWHAMITLGSFDVHSRQVA